jgi:hypothetical protein
MSGENESQIDEAIRVCGMGLFNLRSVSTMQTHLPNVKLFLRFLINEQINGEQALVDEAGAVATALEAFASPSTPGQGVDQGGTLINFFTHVSGHTSLRKGSRAKFSIAALRMPCKRAR